LAQAILAQAMLAQAMLAHGLDYQGAPRCEPLNIFS